MVPTSELLAELDAAADVRKADLARHLGCNRATVTRMFQRAAVRESTAVAVRTALAAAIAERADLRRAMADGLLGVAWELDRRAVAARAATLLEALAGAPA